MLQGAFLPTFFRGKFEWQTSGDNGKQQALIDMAAKIRPAVALIEVLPDVKGEREGGKKTKVYLPVPLIPVAAKPDFTNNRNKKIIIK